MPAVRSSLRSISAVKSLACTGLPFPVIIDLLLGGSAKTEPVAEIIEDKFGAL